MPSLLGNVTQLCAREGSGRIHDCHSVRPRKVRWQALHFALALGGPASALRILWLAGCEARRADPASVLQLAAGFCGLGWARASLALVARGMIHQNRLPLALILVALLLHAGFADGEQDSTVGCIRGDCSEGVMPSLLVEEIFIPLSRFATHSRDSAAAQ